MTKYVGSLLSSLVDDAELIGVVSGKDQRIPKNNRDPWKEPNGKIKNLL